MITKKYIISNATNRLFYTDNHDDLPEDRWTPNMLDAFQFSSYADAEAELDNEYFYTGSYMITEILNK
jgi:hypothetical protein